MAKTCDCGAQIQEAARLRPSEGLEARREEGEETHTNRMPPARLLEEEERRRDLYRL